MSSVTKAQKIVKESLFENNNLHQVAHEWGVNYGHLWRLLNEDHLSPTLEDKLIELGFFDPPPTRHRICYEAGYDEGGEQRKEEIYRWLEYHKFESFTDFIDQIVPGVEEWLNRAPEEEGDVGISADWRL